MRTPFLALAVAFTLGAQASPDFRSDPWHLIDHEQAGSALGVWLPARQQEGSPPRVHYGDALYQHAALLEADPGSAPVTVISVTNRETLLPNVAWDKADRATLTANGVTLPQVACPIAHFREQDAGVFSSLTFASLPKGCDAFELTLPQATGTLVLRFRRLSRRIKDAEPQLAAWIKHANSPELRVISAIQPYLDCDGYRAFAQADGITRQVLLIRELTFEVDNQDHLARFLAWHALLETPFGQTHLKGCHGTPREVRRALQTWRKQGTPGLPKECPGSSVR